MKELKATFEQPESAYRGKPFWAWNGKLEEGELRRQIRVMHGMGLGGFFMHSRVGLATPYLSEEWFDLVSACVGEARKLGMEAWLYDEDRWPSGAAGGIVTSDPRYRHRNLSMHVGDPAEADLEDEPLAVFCAKVDGLVATDVKRLPADRSAGDVPDGERLLAFFVKVDDPHSWYNDATYLDTMNHEAVQKFIEVTHEAYKREVGEEFGGLIPGIFTDEPHHGWVFGRSFFDGGEPSMIPWTDKLPAVFQERYGYDILDHLPELFFDVEGAGISQARYHYHDCKTHLFVDAFSRQIGEWCAKNELLFTGHSLAEATLRSQAQVGGAPMRFYEFMQAPGIDMLTDNRIEYGTAKQCSSVKHQMGRRWMLSELYGCTGWDWPFEGHKASGDWQAALGVNLRCQHLAWYTMSGQAKRDYPASLSFQSPWWEHYGIVEDYYARVNAVLSRGEAVRDVLVVHPVESAWARAHMGWMSDEAQQRLEDDWDALLHWLLDEHLDFDFGDEEMMSRLSAVRNEDGPVLTLGKAAYRAVIVQPMDTIRSSTLALLEEFSEAGGTVIFAGTPPTHVDALPSDAAAQTAEGCVRVPFEPGAVAEALESARVVSIADANGNEKAETLYMLRSDGEDRLLFICNTDRENATGELTVEIRGGGQVQLWDAETGRRYAVETTSQEGRTSWKCEMAPAGSRIYTLSPEAEDLPAPECLEEVRAVGLPGDNWTTALNEPNVLVLDTPEFSIDEGEWQGPLEILKADRAIREAMGLPTRGARMVQPWAREKKQGPTAEIALRYTVRVDNLPRGPVHLALEQPDRFEITLNGVKLPQENASGWWVDPAIRLLPIEAAALHEGDNELLLRGKMSDDCNLEAAFLLGDFAVTVEGADARITGDLPALTFGDCVPQGLPFYSGNIVYRTSVPFTLAEGERAFVEVPKFRGVAARVLVDGQEAGGIGWQPHEVEITDLAAGKDRVEVLVELLGTRRNSFGPLHAQTRAGGWVGAAEFTTSGEGWRGEYVLVPMGVLTPPRISVRRPS